MSNYKSASRLTDKIDNALNSFGNVQSKPVSQMYDEAEKLNGLQLKLSEKSFKYGGFINYDAQKLFRFQVKVPIRLAESKFVFVFSHLRYF